MRGAQILFFCEATTAYGQTPAYKNVKLTIPTPVSDLLSRMSLVEKAQQLRSTFSANLKINAAFLIDKSNMDFLFDQGVSMITPDFYNSLEESINKKASRERH